MWPDGDHSRLSFLLSLAEREGLDGWTLFATADATAAFDTVAEAADSRPTSRAPAQAQLIGDFTGEYVNGAPVYRLPPVTVVGSRKMERVKLEREEQSTRAPQARSKAATRPPA